MSNWLTCPDGFIGAACADLNADAPAPGRLTARLGATKRNGAFRQSGKIGAFHR